jgi:alpha-beta hydrolase superfamily lysophospholipase
MTRTDHRSAAPPFLCELRADGDRATVVTHGMLDTASFPDLEAVVQRLCAAGFSVIALDLRAPHSVDPAGLALLHRIDALASRHDVRLMLDLQRSDADHLLDTSTA